MTLALPQPRTSGPLSFEQVLSRRRSVRGFSDQPLTLEDLAQVLWAGQGITRPDGKRTAPSAGGLYPLELLAAAGRVAGLEAGVYRYYPARHALTPQAPGDQRHALSSAALDQDWMADAPAILAVSAVFDRTTGKYGGRGRQYVRIDAGLAAENICLQATALGLGCTVVGAFRDGEVSALLGLKVDETPLLLLPVGREGA